MMFYARRQKLHLQNQNGAEVLLMRLLYEGIKRYIGHNTFHHVIYLAYFMSFYIQWNLIWSNMPKIALKLHKIVTL